MLWRVGMPYRREKLEVLNTIRKAGNNAKIEVIVPKSKSTFSGKTKGKDSKFTAYFVQIRLSNGDIEKNPNLVDGATLLVTPLDSDGKEITNFTELIKDKAASVITPNGKKLGISTATLTQPDGITTIMARIVIGG